MIITNKNQLKATMVQPLTPFFQKLMDATGEDLSVSARITEVSRSGCSYDFDIDSITLKIGALNIVLGSDGKWRSA